MSRSIPQAASCQAQKDVFQGRLVRVTDLGLQPVWRIHGDDFSVYQNLVRHLIHRSSSLSRLLQWNNRLPPIYLKKWTTKLYYYLYVNTCLSGKSPLTYALSFSHTLNNL